MKNNLNFKKIIKNLKNKLKKNNLNLKNNLYFYKI